VPLRARVRAGDRLPRPPVPARAAGHSPRRSIGDGFDLLAQVELVEVGGWAVASEVGAAFGLLVDDERVAVFWSFRQSETNFGTKLWTADERSSSPPRRPHQMHPASMGRGRWRQTVTASLALLREQQDRPPQSRRPRDLHSGTTARD